MATELYMPKMSDHMEEGQITKWMKEICLLDQPFVEQPVGVEPCQAVGESHLPRLLVQADVDQSHRQLVGDRLDQGTVVFAELVGLERAHIEKANQPGKRYVPILDFHGRTHPKRRHYQASLQVKQIWRIVQLAVLDEQGR